VYDYIIADTHFGHENILLYEPSRLQKARIEGYEDFDEFMIDVWNERVKPNDKVLHLGDFAFKNGYKIAQRLNGDITLIRGNHDRDEHIRFYKKLGWGIIDKITLNIPKPHIIFNSIKKSFSKEILSNKLLACLVCDIDDKRVMFSHFPVFDDNPYDKKYSNITSVLEYIFEESKCDMNIHGHTHSHGAKEPFCKSACLELNDFDFIDKIV